MKRQLNFQCWNCSRNYSLLKELEGYPKLTIQCPYCGQEGIVDLDPYREKVVAVFKNARPWQGDVKEYLNLPETLPTTPPEK